jgi:hypothetical protein
LRLAKTEAGTRVLKDRSVALSPRQRAAFILCDAKHSREHILAATRSVGVTDEDIQHLLATGLIAEVFDAQEDLARRAAEAMQARTPQQRYAEAYPIATRLTASLGLKGFRLNLAVEHALDYGQLCEVAPRIKEVIGARAYAPLEQALFA